MVSICLPASFFAKPSLESFDILDYVEAICEWSEVATIVETYRSRHIEADLYEFNEHPDFWLSQLSTDMAAQHIQSSDVIRTLRLIMRESVHLESKLEDSLVKALIPDGAQVQPWPLFSQRTPLEAEFIRSAAILAYLQGIDPKSWQGVSMVDMNISPQADNEIVITGKAILERSAEAELEEIEETTIDAKINFATTLNEWYQYVDPLDIWAGSPDGEGLHLAIKCYAYKRYQGRITHLALSRLEKFTFGASFWKTIASQHFNVRENCEAVVRACTETILEIAMRDTHQFRTGRGGGDPQMVRDADGARAWRRTVDQSDHGHRLHYWETQDGRVEFATVVDHNDMKFS